MTFCTKPFDHIHTDSLGRYNLCCRAKKQNVSINDVSPLGWFNSDIMNEIRDIFLNEDASKNPLTKELCSHCWKTEEQGIESYRQLSYNPAIETYARTQPKLDRRIIKLQVTIFGNHCNLACIMCSPKNSSRREIDLPKIAIETSSYNNDPKFKLDIDSPPNKLNKRTVERFINEDIYELLPYLSHITFIGGEPMMLYDHYRVLDVIVNEGHAKDISIGYISNITQFKCRDKNFFDYIDKFKRIHIDASLDSHGKYYEYIRRYSDWDNVANNILLLQSQGVSIRVLSTLSALTVLRAKEFYDTLKDMRVDDINFDNNIVTHPSFLHVKHLPQHIKDNLLKELPDNKQFKTYRKLLEQEGDSTMLLDYLNDIDNYYGTSYKDTWPELDK